MIFRFTNNRPIIRVLISGPAGQSKVDALLDSGADHSLFDLEFAKNLGLDFKAAKSEPFGGIGEGTIKVLTMPVLFQIPGVSKKVKVPIGFLESPSFPPLLGVAGIFDNFVIKFDKAHNKIEIT